MPDFLEYGVSVMRHLFLCLSFMLLFTKSEAFVFQARGELCGYLDASWTPRYSNIQVYWKLDGGIGSQPEPGTHNSQAKPDGYQGGTYRNANGTGLTFTSGVVGTALSFDGIDDYMSVGYTEKLTPANAITITNTSILAAATVPTSGGAYAAAKYCKDMNFGGHQDWYLPSKSELAYIYCKSKGTGPDAKYPNEDPNCANYGRESLLSGFAWGTYYWSSTEYNTNLAVLEHFYDGHQFILGNKYDTATVRCVRRF